MKRESFRSRLGFLLVSAGCAIGIGNVWRFPYIAGKNGGGYFVLFYLLCLLVMGVPVLTMELAVGRAEPQERRAGLQDAGKARPEMAHPRLVLPDRLLPADDVLHHRLRLDGQLLRQVPHRRVPCRHGARMRSRAPSARCSPTPARWRSGRRSWSSRASWSARFGLQKGLERVTQGHDALRCWR